MELKKSNKILIFRIGQLGDTLVSVPALWAVREHFRNARLTLLCDGQVGRGFVLASEVLEGAGIVDGFLYYPIDNSALGKLLRPLRMLILLMRLVLHRFDALVYLPPSLRSRRQVARDLKFFGLAGLKNVIGTGEFEAPPRKTPGEPLPLVPQEGELLLDYLERAGIRTPPPGKMRIDLNTGTAETLALTHWLERLPEDNGRRWIAVGPGSKMPVKRWPLERYAEIVQRLIDEFDIWPVVFGGAEDERICESLVSGWNRGYVAADRLEIRTAIAAMARCLFYLGNDTGTMHMAVAAGIKCVGIFSARDYPGYWYPLGGGHIVLRNSPPCEGCMLQVCNEFGMECILSISVNEVHQACRRMYFEHNSPG